MLNRKKHVEYWFVALLVIVTYIDVAFYWLDLPEPEFLLLAWSFVFYVLIIMWIEIDARGRENVYLPFEYGFLVYIFGLIYIPYYFIRTRKWHGISWLIGLVVLFYLSYILKLAIYYTGL